MPFIGNQPAEAYSSFQKQDFSTSATTSYTLDHPVANGNEIALFINFVRQEPTAAYTASGTSLTLTSATSASDDMYCVYLGKAVQTVNPPSGSVGSSQVAASIITGQTAETSIATDDTVLIHDTSAGALRKMTRANFVSGVGGDNTPAFKAKRGSAQTSIADSTATTIICDSEEFDTDSAYNTSTGIFTVASGEGGNYMFGGAFRNNEYLSGTRILIYLTIDGTIVHQYNNPHGSNGEGSSGINVIVSVTAGQQVKIQVYQNTGANLNLESLEGKTYFNRYKLVE